MSAPCSREIVYSFGDLADALADPIFKSSALIAPAALAGAIACATAGMPVLAAALTVLFALGCVGIFARFVAPFRLRVTKLDGEKMIKPGTSGARLRVVFFSDLHLGQFKQAAWMQKVVDLVNAQSPDLVLIGGDFIGRLRGRELAPLFAPLKDLRATQGVFAVLGNHDYGIPGPDHSAELFALLPALGVTVMRNSCQQIGEGVMLLGLDELWAAGSDYRAAQGQCQHAGAITLVLGHNPDAMDKIPVSAVRDPERSLYLFGHTHGGQIRVPGFPGAAIPIKGTLYRGSYSLPQGRVYVSCGLGENTSPTRLGTVPEIVVFDVTP